MSTLKTLPEAAQHSPSILLLAPPESDPNLDRGIQEEVEVYENNPVSFPAVVSMSAEQRIQRQYKDFKAS